MAAETADTADTGAAANGGDGRSARRATALASLPIGGLVAVWFGLATTRWARWGDVTIDSGREAYVPWLLSHGRTLYRDLWYPYGPIAPYANAGLMRVFGATFTTLYVAGLIALLVQALALYACGTLLRSRLAGFGAGLVVLLQSVHHSLFSFPLPYSFAAVYGTTISALLAVALIVTIQRDSRRALLVAASLAALALLTKLEYGLSCYAALAGVLVLRQLGGRSLDRCRRDLVVVAPGVAACIVVLGWMVSLRDFEFITNENMQSWPGTYFMRTYGRHWIALTGGSAPLTDIVRDLARAASYLAVWRLARATVVAFGDREHTGWVRSAVLAGTTVGTGVVALLLEGWAPRSLSALVLPSNLLAVLALVALPLAWAVRSPSTRREATALLALVVVAILVGGRAGFGLPYSGYSIYYNGLSVVALLVVVSRVATWSAAAPSTRATRAIGAALVVAATWLMAVQATAPRYTTIASVPVASDRGTLRIPLDKLTTYQAAVQFMERAHAQGDVVLSIPEDVTLYFLAGIEAPTRAYVFTPGLVTPGRMTAETIAQIEAAPVRYLLVSTRSFPEYGAPRFGTDFDQELGAHLLAHYRELGPLVDPTADFTTGLSGYSITVWERTEP